MTTIGVVLPYYQREAGLLQKALRSVFSQSLPEEVKLVVVVVDDASPFPPEPDLAALELQGHHDVVLLRRKNGGPGPARNTGLDYFTNNPVEFVAFLDTDDIWMPHHLSTALECLGEEGDYFFADHTREALGNGATYFEVTPLVRQWLKLGSDSPFEAAGSPCCYRFKEHQRLLPFMGDYLSQTSTVVYRQKIMKDIRFDPSLQTAGEDYLFWMSLAVKARQIVFTTQLGASCGSGVNIFYSTLDWNHPGAPASYAYQMLLWQYVRDRFNLSSEEQKIVASKIAGFERAFSYLWIRAIFKSGRTNIPLLRQIRDHSDWRPWRLGPAFIGTILRRLAGKKTYSED